MQSNQFNPINQDNPDINGRQLTRAAQIAQASMLSSGPNAMVGISGMQTREEHPEPDTAWFKIISEVGAGKYTCRRQTWKVSTTAFVDATNVTDQVAYERSDTTGIALGEFFFSQREFEVAGEIVVVFDWFDRLTRLRPFPARLLREDVCSLGEYDQWAEVETDDANPNTWQAKAGGRTHTTTSESLWEANKMEDIPTSAVCGWSTIVWVHEENGDEHRYTFDFQKVRGDNTVVGTKAAQGGISSDAAEWIQIENDGRIVRGMHCPPGPCCYSIGVKEDCNFHFNYFELDELGHVREIGAYNTDGEPVWVETGPCTSP